MKLSPDNLTPARKNLIILSFLLLSFPVFGQIDEEPPVSPVFRMVTINQVTGNTEMTWSLSPSADVAGYIVYIYQNGEGYGIDTLHNPSASFYSVFRPGTGHFSESYVVAAFDTAGNISPLSNDLNTIFTDSRIDTCNKKILISWNKYLSYPVAVTGYDVLASVNDAAYYLAGHVSDAVTSFTVDDFTNGAGYCFVIKALLENGQASASNKSCLTAKMQKPPAWINADYATVTSPNEISLKFTVDPSSEISLFGLERKSGNAGTFQQIDEIRVDIGSVTYTDKTADLSVINYYRLAAINSCDVRSVYSNVASNMVLTVSGAGNEIVLTWNKYRKWLGSVSGYRLFMNTGSGFTQKASLQPSDTIYSVSIPEIMYTVKGGEVCFYVTAEEVSNPYGASGESFSNQACFAIDEVITVPNVFTPDGDSKNDLFRPVITFSPSGYQLVISNRQGKIVFTTRDFTESWDGSDNGNPVSEGVYIWILKLTTPAGKSITRTGTLTLVKNRR